MTKVADQLLAFFKTDPVATPWFLKTPDNPPTISYTLDPPGGTYAPGTAVTFHASATPYGTRTIAEYLWTFDDGNYAYHNSDPTKGFPARSQSDFPYLVHLTVIDSEGNAALTDIPITVDEQPRIGSAEDTKHRPATLPRSQQGAARKVGIR